MEENTKGAHLLIVDDNPKNLQVLGAMLNEQGYQVIIAQSGEQTLHAVQTIVPDLILLDVMMPGMDGFETCERLKAMPSMKNVPIVFLTAKTETDDVVRGFGVGAVDYVMKPFNSSELLTRVQNHLQLKFSRETIARQRNELKEMVHVLCHDLSNPLQTIVAYLQMAKKKPHLLEQRRELMLSAASQGTELIQLVQKLQAIESGKTDLLLNIHNLKKLIEKSLEVLEPQFSKKQIHPILHIDNDLMILAEHTSVINSVLNNLLTNAIKFSFPESQVVLEANLHEDSQIQLHITDSGIGIPPGLLDDLFQMDRVTTRYGTDGESGTGFGMPLVKKFMELYGGTIEILSTEKSESTENHGTEVILTFKTSQ